MIPSVRYILTRFKPTWLHDTINSRTLLRTRNTDKLTKTLNFSATTKLYQSGLAVSDPNVKQRELSNTTLEESLKHDDYFEIKKLVTLQKLFDAGVHYGHKEGMGWETMTEYLVGHRFGTCIFDLNHTVPLLQDALNFMAHIAFRNGVILFISNHRETVHMVETTAIECGEYAYTKEWIQKVLCDSTLFYGDVTRLPDLIVLLNTKTTVFEEHGAVQDAAKMLIPTIAICDSDTDPRLITYPIPGNDDSVSAIKLYLQLFKDTILKAKTKRSIILLGEEKERDALLGSEDSTVLQKNTELLAQIAALQDATLRSSEILDLETEAKKRVSEFEQEEEEEKQRLRKKHEKKIKNVKKTVNQKRKDSKILE